MADTKNLPGAGNKLYEYNPLEEQEIRLLQITKGRPGRQYEIVHHLASQAPAYNTISYVWGDDIRDQPLRLVDDTTLMINRNLALAIPYLSPMCSRGYLWADQISIDQANTLERNHQVKQMGRIYSRCNSVLVWLGPELDHAALKYVVDEIKKTIDTWQGPEDAWEGPGDAIVWRLANTFDATPFADQQEIACRLADIQWFFRIWIVQKFVLPPAVSVVLGHLQISYPQLTTMMQVVMSKRATERALPTGYMLGSDLLPHMLLLRHLRGRYHVWTGEDMHFQHTLCHIAPKTQCSDPRDLVYALSGLSGGKVNIVPDYNADVITVFSDTTFEIIRSDNNLGVLENVDRMTTRLQMPTSKRCRLPISLPSWVPDYRIATARVWKSVGITHQDSGAIATDEAHRASRCWSVYKYPPRASCNNGSLRVYGRCTDHIVAARAFSLPSEWAARTRLNDQDQALSRCHDVLVSCGVFHWVANAFKNVLLDNIPPPSKADVLYMCLQPYGIPHRHAVEAECQRLCRNFYRNGPTSSLGIGENSFDNKDATNFGRSRTRRSDRILLDISAKPSNIFHPESVLMTPRTNLDNIRLEHSLSVYPINGKERTLILTAKGHVGFAENVQVGDHITVLHGCVRERPFLLRPLQGRPQHFELVHQSYLWIATGQYTDWWAEEDAHEIILV